MSSQRDKSVRFASGLFQKGFTAVPNVILLDARLSGGAVRLWAALAYYARQEESVFVGQEKLGESLGMQERQLRRLLTELKGAHLLEVKRRGQGRENQYTLLLGDREQAENDRSDMSGLDRSDMSALERTNMTGPYRDVEKEQQERTSIEVPGAGSLDRLPSQDYSGLSMLLADGLVRFHPSIRVSPDSPSWLADMRALVERDGWRVEEVRRGIEAGLNDKFFRSRITTPKKLRAVFGELWLRLCSDGSPSAEPAERCPLEDPTQPSPPAAAVERWAAALELLAGSIPKSTFALWVKPLHVHGFDADGGLLLGAPDARRKGWAEGRHSRVIRAALGDAAFTVVVCADAREEAA